MFQYVRVPGALAVSLRGPSERYTDSLAFHASRSLIFYFPINFGVEDLGHHGNRARIGHFNLSIE
jgi:hypothetical protein